MTKAEYFSAVSADKKIRDIKFTVILIILTQVRLERWDNKRDDIKISLIALDEAESWSASRWYYSKWNNST